MTAPFEQWAEANLRIAKKGPVEWTCWCNNPAHDDTNPSMDFNIEKGLFLCFSCGHRGKVSANGVMNIPEYDFDAEMDLVREKLNALEEGENPPARRVEESILARYRVDHPFWEERKIHEWARSKFQLGYDVYKDAATIPIRNINGRLLGVTHRFLGKHEGGKYHDPFGFRKAENLFASWLVMDDPDIRRVAMTEGPIDAIRLWQAGVPALAIFGAAPSEQQALMVEQLGVEEVVLFFDNDREGRRIVRRALGWWWDEKKRREIYKRETDMAQYALVRVVDYKLRVKDPGDMSDYAIRRHVDRAVPIL